MLISVNHVRPWKSALDEDNQQLWTSMDWIYGSGLAWFTPFEVRCDEQHGKTHIHIFSKC
jgi:hypothetical protein